MKTFLTTFSILICLAGLISSFKTTVTEEWAKVKQNENLEDVSAVFHNADFHTWGENNLWNLTNTSNSYIKENQQNLQPVPDIVHTAYFPDTNPGWDNRINNLVTGIDIINTDLMAKNISSYKVGITRQKQNDDIYGTTSSTISGDATIEIE